MNTFPESAALSWDEESLEVGEKMVVLMPI
jgi:hypothetical protein